MIALSILARILRKVLETWGDLLSLKWSTRLGVSGWERWSRGFVQKTEFWPYYQMVYVQTEYVQENKTHKILWDFEIQMNHLIIARRPDLVIINKKRKILLFNEPQSENKRKGEDKYLDIAREQKKLCNMQLMVIPIVVGAWNILTGLKQLEIRGRIKTIQNIALLRLTRILRRVLVTWRDLQSFRLH